MKEELISLAKEKGFKSKLLIAIIILEKLIGLDLFYYLWLCDLQKWLREKHIVFVRPEWFWCFKSESGKYQVFVDRDYENISGAYKVTFDTYKEALEKGLFEALKLIK